jgi:TonB family protein
MYPFLIYLIQVNIALAMFYLLYALLLKGDTFLRLRRSFFMLAIVFSLFYPLFSVPALGEVLNFRSTTPVDVERAVFIEDLDMSIVPDDAASDASSFLFPWEQILTGLFVVVTSFFVLRFFWQLFSIVRIRLHSKVTEISGITVCQLPEDMTPFSFFKWIFIHTEKHAEAETRQILLHEQTHVRQWHSLDIILVEILSLFSWWNPFVWLMKREMAMNLEYLADNGVLREGIDSREYQFHLLRLTYHETAVQIVNNFNVSQLKQRIMMMNKKKSTTPVLAKYLLILPLVFMLIAANSVYAARKETKSGQTTGAVHDLLLDESVSSPVLYDSETENVQDPPPVKKEDPTQEIFVVVEDMPEFPGGNEAMVQFLADNIQYPEVAKENGIQGRVTCQFVVLKDGTVSDVKIIRGVDPSIDAEAVRVLETMPAWKPGKQRGQAVNVQFTLPVVFSLKKDESKIIIDELKTNERSMSVQAQVQHNFLFPGGNKEFMRFISERIKYPVEAQEKGVQGVVNASFRINNAGDITGAEVTGDSDEMAALNNEVLRVIREMPRWEKDEYMLVSGRVTDSGSQPLQGASVIIRGTGTGMITDANGHFQLKVPAGRNTLAISFVGYKTEEILLSNLKSSGGEIITNLPVVFRLQGDDTSKSFTGPASENTVIVVGYGVKKQPEIKDPR